MRRKIIIGLLLSSGIFVITAAVLRCVLTLAATDHIGVSTIWAIRETFVSLIAISAPAIKPLFNKNSWVGSASSKNGASSGRFKKFSGNNTLSAKGTRGNQTMMGSRGDDLEVGSSRKGPHSMESEMELKDISHNGSEENIIDNGKHNSPLEINVTTAYALDNEEQDRSPTRVLSDGARDGRESATVHDGGESKGKTDRWGSSTKVTAGDRAERSNNKAMKMLGGGWS